MDSLGQSNPNAKENCLSDATTCADAMAEVIQGAESLEVKRKIAARNLRAMKRLSRWTVYNRRRWTELTQKFKGVQVMISYVKTTDPRPKWQSLLFFKGKISTYKMLGLGPDGIALAEIKDCAGDLYCNLHDGTGQNKNLRNDGGSGHLDHLHLGIYKQ